METDDLRKYPRTPHLTGSGIQHGDETLGTVPFAALAGCHLIVTEKMDGANCGLSFLSDGMPRLQSRGHYLVGGGRERQFDRLKAWAYMHTSTLFAVLGDRYILYGEWLYAKHTVFYTQLPDYFLAFDCYDRRTETFLDTPTRTAILTVVPFVQSARVVHTGTLPSLAALTRLIGPSPFIGRDALLRLHAACLARGLDPALAATQTDQSGLMEGVYVKVEARGIVQARVKYVRRGFHQTMNTSGDHWSSRPLIPNELSKGEAGND